MPILESAKPRTRPRLVAAGLVLVVLVAAVGFGARWWTHPSVFGDGGYSFRADPRPIEDAGMDVAVTFNSNEDPVTLGSAEPVWGNNTARATVTFRVCRATESRLAIGAPSGSAELVCDPLRPLADGTELDPSEEFVIATITPTAAGVARLVGVRLSYRTGLSHLFQRGTEVMHLDAATVAR